MVELPAERRRKTRVLRKGNFLDPGDPVEPGVPAALHPYPSGALQPAGACAWLVDPRNPLAARVAVNRYWSQVFGAGLVATEEDFGTQGDSPSHPELLDWLAVRYRDSGWDAKALLRLLVTSAVYRQSSKVNPELLRRTRGTDCLREHPRAAGSRDGPGPGTRGFRTIESQARWTERVSAPARWALASRVQRPAHVDDQSRR